MQALLLIPGDNRQFHFGESGLGDSSDLLHSDTLFSALATIYEYALGGAERLIELVGSGRLSFSSGLYALLKETSDKPPLLFVPKPLVTYTSTDDRKRNKSLKYFSLGALAEFSQHFNAEKLECDLDLTDLPSIGNDFVCLPEELDDDQEAFAQCSFRGFTTSPKVKVHTTVEDNDRLYYETTVQFHSFSVASVEYEGAYCVLFDADRLNPEERREFLAAVRIMADEGVGGQRSSGNGQFRAVREVTIPVPGSSDASCYLGLSVLSPADSAEFDALERYELFVRGGGSLGLRGESEQHRKQARFIREGSVMNRNISGRIVDLSPTDAVAGLIVRNGRNFFIPI
ncbi:MAG: type III-A CRISPR-associated RAMP protein Csm4 [Chlorobiaceae bacterium]|nr:type III-A CRISPR-associated RAMP protein Csm4 [Chlorobiaceae bacterium]